MSTSDEPSKKTPARSRTAKSVDKPKITKPPEQATIVLQEREVLAALGPVVAEGKEHEAVLRVQSLMRSYQGPIPLAAEFASYERTHPGAADRILTLTENDQRNSFELNRLLLTSEGRLRSRGQILAFLSLLAMLGVTLTCVLTGHPVVGSVFGGGTIIAVVAMFLRQQATIKNADGEVRVGDPSG